jgi:hypothetical protein
MKRFIVEAVTDLAGLLLLIFCGAGVYWNVLWWWRDPSLADFCAFVVPVVLLYVTLLSPRLRSGIAGSATDETSLEGSRSRQKWDDEEKLVKHIDKDAVFREYIHLGWTVQRVEEAIAKYSSLEKEHSIKATLDFENKARLAFGLEALNDLPAARWADDLRWGCGPIWKALEPIGCDYLNRWSIYFKTPEAARGVAWATGAQYYESLHSRAVSPSWEIGQVQIWWEAGNLPEYIESVGQTDPNLL